MDFVDFDSFPENVPAPQPALSIPISHINLPKKMPNLSDLKNILNFESPDASETVPGDQLSEKYARLSLELVRKQDSGLEKTTEISNYNLSNKLSKVLNAPMSDALTRGIFNNLHTNYDTDDLIDPGLVGSLKRKNLRSKIEANLIKNQTLMLKEYAPVIKQFKQVHSKLENLNQLNSINNKKLDQVFQDLEQFNKEFKALNDDKSVITLQKNLLRSFKEKFTLNEFEEFTLNNNELNADFCKVLFKLDKINQNSSILLSIDNSKLGLVIMQKLSKLTSRANDTLFSFCKKSLYNVQFVNNTEKLYRFHLYFKIFHKRNQSSFNELIGDFVEERSTSIIDEFADQFNSGISPDATDVSKPILMSSHDPTRFVGDLLAHVHSLVINELELINSVFTINDDELTKKPDFVGSSDDASKTDMFELVREDQKIFVNIAQTVADKIFEKLSKTLRSKFEQLISIESKIKNVYSLFNILELYKLMFKKLLHSGSLLNTIDILTNFCRTKILDLVDSNLKSIKNSNAARLDINSDLQPPEWIIEFYADILAVVEQSKMSFDSILNFTEDQNTLFQEKIINEPIKIFKQHIEGNQEFNKREMIILELNFVDQILAKILPINLLNDKIVELDALVDELKTKLIALQLDQLLRECQLYDYYNIVNMILPLTDDFFDLGVYQPITENKLFTTEHLEKSNKSISDFVPKASLELENDLMKLNNPAVVNDVAEWSLVSFMKFYVKFDKIVQEYLHNKLVWSDIEVATLLGVDEVYVEEKAKLDMS